jgi:hypothetical protein
MATPTLADGTQAIHDSGKPNHMIFWLDVNIGNPNDYVHLKKAFASNTDPRCEAWTMLAEKDYDAMLTTENAVGVTFECVEFLLQVFNNEDACLKAFKQNQDKRIFFITSGPLGRCIVPKIIERYRHIFTDPITNVPYPSIYIFCHHIDYEINWAMEYLDYVQIFNFDSELLERMTRDIAEYYIEQGRRMHHDNDLNGALRYLCWAKKLWYQYDKMQQQISTDDLRPVRRSQRMSEISNLIAEIEVMLTDKSFNNNYTSNSDDDDANTSESCYSFLFVIKCFVM